MTDRLNQQYHAARKVHSEEVSSKAWWYVLPILLVCIAVGTVVVSKTNVLASEAPVDQGPQFTIIDSRGKTVATRISPPQGYSRTEASDSSFVTYARQLAVKPHDSPVLLYNGSLKGNQAVHAAVLDLPIGNKDLHQCADAAMRIKADYLRATGKQDDIHFNLTNGHQIDYAKWREGYRIIVRGNKTEWVLKEQPTDSEESYWNYLELIYTYAGTLSLSKELEPAPVSSLSAGHLWLQGGSPGHAVLVLDECIHLGTGEKLYLLAQSYMPAQETHILVNKSEPDISPWYRAPAGTTMGTPEWTFDTTDLYYFAP